MANNLTTTSSGYALDARQGKELQNQITTLNTKIGTITTEYFQANDRAFWLNSGVYIVINDYLISGTGSIGLSIYNFTKDVSFGYRYNLTSPSGVRGNMVRIIELTESTQVGVHVSGTLTSIGAQLTAIRIK